MHALEIEKLNVRYGKVVGTRDLSLKLDAGHTLALIGANGAGKSSTLRAVMGLAPYESGTITSFGRRLTGIDPAEVVGLGIAFSPEGRRVFSGLTVGENLRLGGYSRPGGEVRDRLEKIYGYFPRLKERTKQRAESLSGGEQQMLAIGRALMSSPAVLLLDEPSLGLAPIVVESIGDILAGIQKDEGLSVVLAEQNANWALEIASDVVVLELGTVVLEGRVDEVKKDDRVMRAFVGI
jgi:branched-chain amino acid transport system ATP-binding protein